MFRNLWISSLPVAWNIKRLLTRAAIYGGFGALIIIVILSILSGVSFGNACDDAGGVYIRGYCIDRSAIIEVVK